VLARWTGSLPAIGARQVSAQVPGAAVVPRIVRELDEVGIELAAFSMRKSSLDEVFLTLTGHRAEEDRAEEDRTEEDRAAEASVEPAMADAADGRRAR
jgi:oleandomycin transport system ATP-binding protein